MPEKVTRMLIRADLQCLCCYMKIKKILCEFPQIRDQMYNEKQNTVLITVVCCSPEKIRQKIICKGGERVQSVEILSVKPKETEPNPSNGTAKFCNPLEQDHEPVPEPVPQNPQQVSPPPTPKTEPEPVAGYPLVPVYPMVGVCCRPPFYGGSCGGPCYCGRRWPAMCHDGCGRPADECQGRNRGSCHGLGRLLMCDDGCGRPANECQGRNRGCYPGLGRPMMCDDGCGRPANECRGRNRGYYPELGRPVMCDDGCGRSPCECQGGNRGYYSSRSDYFIEENATACTVM
ncbi:uncharacterized protein J3R85_006809 [Psidium guajava]|nr:uncharacterized protein J3R85_006809 [Psidium guajava]